MSAIHRQLPRFAFPGVKKDRQNLTFIKDDE